MQAAKPPYRVRAVHCDHQAGEGEIYAALKRATDPLEQAWTRLQKARRIGIKFNQAWPPDKLVLFEGQFQQLVSERVARATLRLLRERTKAELVCAEISVFKRDRSPDPGPTITLLHLLREYGVEFVDGNLPPHKTYEVPDGGSMFRQYLLPQRATDVDAFVSVQKMKNHAFMGVTLCLKNLFGLTCASLRPWTCCARSCPRSWPPAQTWHSSCADRCQRVRAHQVRNPCLAGYGHRTWVRYRSHWRDSMKIGVMVLEGPYQHQAADSAYHFIQAAQKRGHEIVGVFLYTDGVNNTNKFVKPPGERNIAERFDALGEQGNDRALERGHGQGVRGISSLPPVPPPQEWTPQFSVRSGASTPSAGTRSPARALWPGCSGS